MKTLCRVGFLAGLFALSSSEVANAGYSCNSHFVTHRSGEYILANDLWGRGNVGNASYNACIWWSDVGQKWLPWGWNWSWPSGYPNIKSYQSIRYGVWNHWGSTASTTSKLPQKIDWLPDTWVNYNVSQSGMSGSWNLSIDAWVNSSSSPNGGNTTAEIMIWENYSNLNPAGNKIGTFTFWGTKYDLYESTINNGIATWKYLAFKRTSKRTSGTLRLRNFTDHLVYIGKLNKNHYLTAIEFGHEVESGSGNITLNSFDVNMN